MGTLDRLLARMDDLPTLPHVAMQVWKLEEDSTPTALSSLIELDHSLSARVVRMANAAVFGGKARIDSVPLAVTRLGTRRARQLVLTAAVIEALPDASGPLDLPHFWSFSLGAGLSAGQLAADLRYEHTDRAYLAGLLHSIGEVILAIYFPSQYTRAWDQAAAGALELDGALEKEFQIGHPALGAHVLRFWRLPESVATAVEWQRDPDRAPSDPLLAGIAFGADRLARAAGLGPSFEERRPEEWLRDSPAGLERALREQGIDGLAAYLAHDAKLLHEIAEFSRGVFSAGALSAPPHSAGPRPRRAH